MGTGPDPRREVEWWRDRCFTIWCDSAASPESKADAAYELTDAAYAYLAAAAPSPAGEAEPDAAGRSDAALLAEVRNRDDAMVRRVARAIHDVRCGYEGCTGVLPVDLDQALAAIAALLDAD